MTGGEQRADRRTWWTIVAIVLAALVLRFICAQGDLWLDEAWSAGQARDAATPIGVFIGINHDNNHHLNSLWMQMIGFGGWPPLLRLLSILSSCAAIAVAARIAEPRGRATMMVTMGSEARGQPA